MYASNVLYVLYLSTILCYEMGETRSEFPEGSVCKAAKERVYYVYKTRVSMSCLQSARQRHQHVRQPGINRYIHGNAWKTK